MGNYFKKPLEVIEDKIEIKEDKVKTNNHIHLPIPILTNNQWAYRHYVFKSFQYENVKKNRKLQLNTLNTCPKK